MPLSASKKQHEQRARERDRKRSKPVASTARITGRATVRDKDEALRFYKGKMKSCPRKMREKKPLKMVGTFR